MTVYIYHDGDHGDIEAFTTLKAAQKHADKVWKELKDDPWDSEGDDIFRHEQMIAKRVVQ